MEAMSKGLYKTFKLVKSLGPGLSVRTWQGRYYLVDEGLDQKIAEAIGVNSVEWAKNDPLLWAVGRLERRIDAIDAEMAKYEKRIADLNAERQRLDGFYEIAKDKP